MKKTNCLKSIILAKLFVILKFKHLQKPIVKKLNIYTELTKKNLFSLVLEHVFWTERSFCLPKYNFFIYSLQRELTNKQKSAFSNLLQMVEKNSFSHRLLKI